jgi:hypothetical protein
MSESSADFVWNGSLKLDLSDGEAVGRALGGEVYPDGIQGVTKDPVVLRPAFVLLVLPYRQLAVDQRLGIFHENGSEVSKLAEHFGRPVVVCCRLLMSRRTLTRSMAGDPNALSEPYPAYTGNGGLYVQTPAALRALAQYLTYGSLENPTLDDQEQLKRATADLNALTPGEAITKFRRAWDLLRHPVINWRVHVFAEFDSQLNREITTRQKGRGSAKP